MRRGSFVVLAGGASRRMGRDKARIPVGGAPLLLRVLEPAAEPAWRGSWSPTGPAATRTFSQSRPPGSWPLRTVTDRRPGRGPLAGLEAGLAAAAESACFVAACDLPTWIPPS